MNIIKEFLRLESYQKRYLIYIFFFWTFKYWDTFWRRIGLEDGSLPNMFLLLFLALTCKRVWNYQVRLIDVFFYVGIVLLYFISGVVYPDSSSVLDDNAVKFLVCTLPFYFVGLTFKFAENRKWVVLFAYFATILNIAYMFVTSNNFDADHQESMRKAYLLVPSLLVILWNCIESKKKIDMFFAALSFLLISGYGTRGPFVCMLFFLAIYFIFYKKWNYPLLVRSGIIFGTYLLYILAEYFAMFMIRVIGSVGLSTRIFDSMLNDAFLNYEQSHGRDEIQDALLLRINNNNGNGFGLFTDRLVGEETYAHNFFVEIWYNFGYYMGSIFALTYLLLVALTLRKTKDRTSAIFVVAMFSSFFVQLMFSSSYLQNTGFFFLMGLCVQNLRKSQSNYYSY